MIFIKPKGHGYFARFLDPHTEKAREFYVSSPAHSVHTVRVFHEHTRSVLVSGHNRICKDASLAVASPCNPVFLLLPVLLSSSGKFVPAADLHETWTARCSELAIDPLPAALYTPQNLDPVCDQLVQSGTVFYRYSQTKALQFVQLVVSQAARSLPSGVYAAHVTDKYVFASGAVPQHVLDLGAQHVALQVVREMIPKRLCDLFEVTLLDSRARLDEFARQAAEQRKQAQDAHDRLALVRNDRPVQKQAQRTRSKKIKVDSAQKTLGFVATGKGGLLGQRGGRPVADG